MSTQAKRNENENENEMKNCMLRWDFSLSIILRIFLIFSYFEPGYSYKQYSYKKTGVSQSCKEPESPHSCIYP